MVIYMQILIFHQEPVALRNMNVFHIHRGSRVSLSVLWLDVKVDKNIYIFIF